jgi:hypothetical protein
VTFEWIFHKEHETITTTAAATTTTTAAAATNEYVNF